MKQRDYITLQSLILIYAVFVVVINLITDLSYGFIDPRVRYEQVAEEPEAEGFSAQPHSCDWHSHNSTHDFRGDTRSLPRSSRPV